ncbi:MAG: EamA family transporter [Nanoarchaeota archaeon]
MNVALLFAILTPLVWGFSNILDKYVIAHKVKNPLSFAVVAAVVNVLIGSILAIFLDWSNVAFMDCIYPIIAGFLLGLQFYFYFLILQKEDVSHILGLVYIYPLLLAILSYIFLKEVIKPLGYIGAGVLLVGIFMLSLRIRKIKLSIGVWMIIAMILLITGYEFFVKIATMNLSTLHGIAISITSSGITVLPALLSSKTRKGFLREIKNGVWAVINECFTFMALFSVYFAMNGLPVTIVASIGAIQPLIVLLIERIADNLFGKITKDHLLLPKLIPITLIVIGVILVYISQLV